METNDKKSASLKLEILDKVASLATAGFGLVAALAWNDAIQSLFAAIFGTQSTLVAKFAYAVLVTVLIVILTYRLGRWADRLKNES